MITLLVDVTAGKAGVKVVAHETACRCCAARRHELVPPFTGREALH